MAMISGYKNIIQDNLFHLEILFDNSFAESCTLSS